MNSDVKYPDIEVELVGNDGNAFHILHEVRKALKANLSSEEASSAWAEFQLEATSGDYDNLLQTVMAWFNVT